MFLLIYAVIAVFALLFYLRAVASRKRYSCPQCGEVTSVELMSASHCNVCGAPLDGEPVGGRS